MSAGQRGLLLAILVVAAVLRLSALDAQSLWLDELASWQQASAPGLREVIARVRSDVHPPLFAILLHFAIGALGDSESALRLPSALAGIAAVYAIFRVGEQLWSVREGLLAAALLAVSWTPVQYAQEARAYSLLLLATLAAFGCALAALRRLERGERIPIRVLAGFWLAATAACYLHYFGLLLVALIALGLGLRWLARPHALAGAALLLLPVGVAYLPWIGITYQDAIRPPGWISPPQPDAPLEYLEFLFKRPGELKRVVGVLLIVFVLVSWRRRGEPRTRGGETGARVTESHRRPFELPATALVCAWLVAPFAAALAISFSRVPVLTARNLIISLPAAYLLLSRATLRLPRRPQLGAALAVALVGMSAFGVLANGRYWRRPHKEQFREAASALVARSWDPAETRILAYPAFGFDYYLARQGAPRSVDFALTPRPRLEAAAPFLAIDRSQTRWLLTAHKDAEPELLLALERDYALVLEERFYYAWLRRYERR